MKYIVRVFVGEKERMNGTLNAAIKAASRISAKEGQSPRLEIWCREIDHHGAPSTFYVATLPYFV